MAARGGTGERVVLDVGCGEVEAGGGKVGELVSMCGVGQGDCKDEGSVNRVGSAGMGVAVADGGLAATIEIMYSRPILEKKSK